MRWPRWRISRRSWTSWRLLLGPLAHETAWEDYDRMLRLNLSPAINLARAAMPRITWSGEAARSSPSRRARR